MRRVLVLAARPRARGRRDGVVIYTAAGEQDIRGSSTEEFVTTEGATRRSPRDDPWPMYGFDSERHARRRARPARRRSAPSGRTRRGSLVEFPPVLGYGRLYFSTNGGSSSPINAKTGKRAWKYISPAASPPRPRSGRLARDRLRGLPEQSAVQREAGDGSTAKCRVRGRPRKGPLAVLRSARRETSPLARRRPCLRRRLARQRLGARRAQRPHGLALTPGGPIKGALAFSSGRLYVGSYDGHLYCLGAQKGRLLWRAKAQGRLYGHGALLLDARASRTAASTSAAPTARSTPSAHPAGSCAGRTAPAATSTRRPRSGTGCARRLVQQAASSRFDAATGEERWHFKANGRISGSAVVIGNVVYFATLASERTYALERTDGQAALDVSRRQVHARRRREGPPLPGRLRALYGMVAQ